jgi:hypothetical protein
MHALDNQSSQTDLYAIIFDSMGWLRGWLIF